MSPVMLGKVKLEDDSDCNTKVFTEINNDIKSEKVLKQNNAILQATGFCCYPCNKGYHTKKLLYYHTLRVHGPPSPPCDVCGKIFRHKIKLKEHKNKIHDNPVSYHCVKCNKKFKNLRPYQQHNEFKCGQKAKRKTKLEICLCNICGKEFRSLVSLKLHKRNTQSKCGNEIVCVLCQTKFKKRMFMKRHMIMIHSVTIEDDLEGNITLVEKDGQKYIMTREQVLQLKCVGCPKTFQSKQSLKYHVKEQHAGQNIFVCGKCEQNFETERIFTQHMNRTHIARKFECELCNHKFKLLQALRNHMKCMHSKN